MTLKNREIVSSAIDESHRHNILADSREIFLHGHIDENVEGDPGVEYRMSNIFLKNMITLQRIDPIAPIIIHQHSCGGEWTEGMMMYDAILTSEAKIVVITHGIAASMGSIVPLAADLRVCMPNCWWMLHEGSTDIHQGLTMRSKNSMHDWEEQVDIKMMDIYADTCHGSKAFKNKNKTNKTKNTIKEELRLKFQQKEDVWMTAEESVSYGLCHGVYGQKGFENIKNILGQL